MIPCKHCRDIHTCEPSDRQLGNGAKMLLQEVVRGDILHNDFAKYQLNLQTQVYGTKMVLSRSDSAEIFHRIIKYVYTIPAPPMGNLAAIPHCLKEHVGEHKTFKMEWMGNGRYLVSMSNSYAENVTKDYEMAEICKKNGIPPKLVDYCGLGDYDMAYRLWVESLYSPGVTTTYTGVGFWRGDSSVCYMTVRVMSMIINHEYLITATTVGRGQMYAM